MDTKEKHIRENESEAKREARERAEEYNTISDSLPAEGKRQKNVDHRKTNKMWIWFGVMILIFILLWWLYSIGTFEALVGTANG